MEPQRFVEMTDVEDHVELAHLDKNVAVGPVFVLPTAKAGTAGTTDVAETLAVSVHHLKHAKMVNVPELPFPIVQEDNVDQTEPEEVVVLVEVVKDAERELVNATTTVMKEIVVTLFNHQELILDCALKDLVVHVLPGSPVEALEDVPLQLPVPLVLQLSIVVLDVQLESALLCSSPQQV